MDFLIALYFVRWKARLKSNEKLTAMKITESDKQAS
jgi:hypothetical protein